MPADKYLQPRPGNAPGFTNKTAAVSPSQTLADQAGRLVALKDDGTLDSALLGPTVLGGAGKAARLVALNQDGYLDESVMPPGYGQDVNALPSAAEALAANDAVHIAADGVRKADAANDRPAHGYVTGAVAQGQPVRVFADGTNGGQTGLTIGGAVYTSATPGKVTQTKPTATGHFAQPIGVAVSATAYDFVANPYPVWNA